MYNDCIYELSPNTTFYHELSPLKFVPTYNILIVN